MRKIFYYALALVALTVLNTSCEEKNPPSATTPTTPTTPTKNNPNKYVNDWIYKNMVTYYLWNDKIPKTPDYTLKPDAFFDTILNKFDANTNPDGDRFSWIQESYVDLLNSLGGVKSDDIGFEFVRIALNENPNQYYLLVLYPKPGSNAEAQGIRKGRFVIKINGNDITKNNVSDLVAGTGSKTLSMADWVLDEESQKYELTSTGDVQVMMHKDFAEIPVYMDSVYTTPNNTKVGYLVYNFFARDKGDNSMTYDKLLMHTLENIKAKGATEFVLDLRYNGGGAVSSANALASALVKNRSTSNLFSTVKYNPLVHNELQSEYGSNYNKTYFSDKITANGETIAIPEMGLNKIYVLVSNWTASASELIINGLKPYMEVVLIGEKTVGKNVGSISLYEEKDDKNKWGMQPIIAKYYNSANQSDFTAGFVPDHEVDEFVGLHLFEFGDTRDKLLNKALSLINGAPLQISPLRTPRLNASVKMQRIKASEAKMEFENRGIIIDGKTADDIRKIMINK